MAEKRVLEIETRTTMPNVDEAIRDARNLDNALDGVARTSDKTEKEFADLDRALDRLNRRYDAGYRATQDFERAQATLNRAVAAGRTTQAEAARVLDLVRDGQNNVGKAVNDNTNKFGLQGYQVRNLTAQFVDLGVQIGSGGGIFRPLIQQGPQAIDAMGGLSRSFGILAQAVTRYGAILAPVAVVTGGFFAALSADRHRRELETLTDRFRILRNEFGRPLSGDEAASQLKAIEEAAKRTGVSLQSVAAAQRDFVESTMRGGSLTKDGRAGIDMGSMKQDMGPVEILARGLKAAGVAGEEAGAILQRFFADIREKGEVSNKTFGELIDRAPKLGKALTDALGGADNLFYRMSQGAQVGGREAVNAINSIGPAIADLEKKRVPTISDAFDRVGTSAEGAMKRIRDAIVGDGGSQVGWLTGLVMKLAEALDQVGKKALALPTLNPGAMNPGPPGSAAQNDPRGRFGLAPQATSPLVPDPGMRGEIVPPITSAVDRTTAAVQEAQAKQDETTNAVTNFGSMTAGAVQTGVRVWNGISGKTDNLNSKTDNLNRTTQQADQGNRAGLSAVEMAIRSMNFGGRSGGETYGFTSYSGTQGDGSLEDAQRMKAIDDRPFDPSRGGADSIKPGSNLPTLSGQGNTITSVLPEGTQIRGTAGAYGLWKNQVGGTLASPSMLAAMGWTPEQIAAGTKNVPAAGASSTASSAGFLDPIQGLIEKLRGQQSDVMGTPYTPDPYADKNPDWFYSGGKMYAAEQNKVAARLQDQIDKLTELAANSTALLQQGQELPANLSAALVSAMVQAGLSGDQIAAALAKTATTTPQPTAQAGVLANRGVVGGNVVMRGFA